MGSTNTQDAENRNIFDNVFRTMIERMPQFFIPLVNEIFGKDFLPDEKIELLKNEHMTMSGKIITDSCLCIENTEYHIECQSKPDGNIALRMFEYDVAIALGQMKTKAGSQKIVFPKSCVIYLRSNKNTKEKERVYVEFANGETVIYEVPIICVESYTKQEIFEKRLTLFLPYYIMRYEKQLKEIGQSDNKQELFLEDYKEIRAYLEELLEGSESVYADLVTMIIEISGYILREEEKLREGVEKIMGGEVMELFSERVFREGREEGREEGRLLLLATLVADGTLSISRAAEKANMSVEEFETAIKEKGKK